MRLLITICLIAALAAPALAQSRKELAAQNAALAQRLSVLESRMLTGDPAAERLMQRMDALEASQRTLTGEIERLRFERDKLRTEIAALNEDIRARDALMDRTKLHLDAVDLLASQPQPMPFGQAPVQSGSAPYTYQGSSPEDLAGQPSPIPGPPTVRDVTIPVQQDFSALSGLPAAGKQKLVEGNFSGAQSDFKRYLDGMPDAPDAGEISFLLGETYYVRQSFADAADAYIQSMRKAPNGIKAPDAMVRLAASLRGLGNTTEACKTLDSFSVQYPNAPATVRDKARTERARTGC